MRRGKPPALRTVINQALPQRRFAVPRDVVIDAIAERVERWQRQRPYVGPHRKVLKQLVGVAEALERAVRKAEARLRALGADRLLASDPETGEPVPRHNVGRGLYLTCDQALRGLRRWNNTHRPRRGPAPVFAAELTSELQHLVRTGARCSAYEFEQFLHTLSDSNVVPKLTVATLRQRKCSGKKQRATI